MTLSELLKQASKKRPFKRCIYSSRKKVSYPQLNHLANQLASYFINKDNLRKGSKIAILQESSIEYIEALFAIAKAGMISVPVNIFFKADEIIYMLNDCEADVLITSTKYAHLLKEITRRTDSLKEIIITDKKLKDYKFLDEVRDKKVSGDINEATNENEVAIISYTSSTTGAPKGVMLTHRNLISNVNSCLKEIELKSNDGFIVLLPMFHSFTLTTLIFLPIAAASRIVITESLKQVDYIMKSIFFKRITILIGIPQVYRVFNRIDLPRIFSWLSFLNPLRLAISGAAALDKYDATKFMEKYKVKLLQGYGLTETSPVVSLNPTKGKNKLDSVGLPLKDVEVKIVNENEEELPLNEIGEIIVKGPNVMKGYYKKPQETAETIKGGWLFTGDIGKIDKEGYVYIVDRKKDIIISHGMNIYPREIEKVIGLNPKVKDVAVIGKKDKQKGEVPLAIVVPEEEASIDKKEIQETCRQHLANYKIPHFVEFQSELPRTPTGKVLKKILREKYQ
jgi:long-chain acyl-CoA synthetase